MGAFGKLGARRHQGLLAQNITTGSLSCISMNAIWYEGSTQFMYEGKPYFYVSDPGAAEWEVKHFRE